MSASVCPSEGTLREFPSWSVDNPCYPALEGHVEQCRACQAVLERLAEEGTTCGSRGGSVSMPSPQGLPEVPGLVIEYELGRGGMGVVYRAWDPLLKRHVALKLVAGGPLAGDRERKRWLREAQAHSRVKHPHVAQVYDVVETEDWLFLVLEHVPGGTLEHRLGGQPLAPRDAAGLLRTIAEAVEAIHQQGLRHLDLKPSNILLDGSLDASWEAVTPKVSDFGIAQLQGDSAATTNPSGGLRGTPSFMAPEQVTVQPGLLGPGADIYALGAMLYTLLTGRPPFQAPTAVEILDMVRREDPVPPRRLNARIPRDLETICLKCLQKDPARRYASAEALAADVGRWLAGRTIAARAVTPPERAWRWCRRRPAVALLLFTLAATVGLSMAALSTLLGRAVAARNQADLARNRAHENQQLASEALQEIAASIANSSPEYELLRREASEYELLRRERLEPFVLHIREQLRDPERRADANPELLASLAILDRALMVSLPANHENNLKSDSLMIESVCLLRECVRRRPGDHKLMAQLTDSLLNSARVAFQRDQLERGLRFADEAASYVRSLEPHATRLQLLEALSGLRRSTAYTELRLGRPDNSRRILEADLRTFESLTKEDRASRDVKLVEALTLVSLRQGGDGLPLVLSSVSGPGLDDDQRRTVADWLARAIERELFDESAPRDSIGTDALDQWADTLIDSLRVRCEALHVDDSLVPLTGCLLSDWVQTGSAALRRQARNTDARRIERRFQAFAGRIVRRYPERVESYITLSESHIQTYKNLIKTGDRDQLLAALQRACDSAVRASSLDPMHAGARRLVDDRKRRLAQFQKH